MRDILLLGYSIQRFQNRQLDKIHLPIFEMKEGVELKRMLSFIISMVLLVSLIGCTSTQELPEAKSTLFAMNTYMTFVAYGENAETALNEAMEQIKTLVSLWSVTDSESEIYRANHSAGQTVTVSQETAELLSFILEMAEKRMAHLIPPFIRCLLLGALLLTLSRFPQMRKLPLCFSM